MSSSAPLAPAVNNPFAGYISQLDAISVDDVVGEARLGPGFSFQDARTPMESIKEFVEQLRFLDGTGLPNRLVGKCSTPFQQLLDTIRQIKDFNIANFSNQNYRLSLIQQLRDGNDNLVEAAVPVLLYGNLLTSGIKTAQANTHAILAEIDKQRGELVGVVKEAGDLLAEQKKFSAEIAIAGYGTLFAKEAREHNTAANKWLMTTGVLAGLMALVAVVNYRISANILDQFSHSSGSQLPQLPASITLQFTLAKVILFTVGLSAAYWSARVYRSHRHNAIVNKHRANALTSFQEFVVSATDPEVKHAILLQTTSCIYAPQPTGFSSGGDTDGESPLKILEIVRNFQK
jgi:hypothetical protein